MIIVKHVGELIPHKERLCKQKVCSYQRREGRARVDVKQWCTEGLVQNSYLPWMAKAEQESIAWNEKIFVMQNTAQEISFYLTYSQ